jgi:hypothetical protein
MAKKGPIRGIQRSMSKANVSLKSISSVLEQQSDTLKQLTDSSAQVQDDKSSGGGNISNIAISVAKAQLASQKEATSLLKRIKDNLDDSLDTQNKISRQNPTEVLKKIRASQDRQIEAIFKSNRDWKSFGDKFKDFKHNMAEGLDVNNIKKKLLGPFTMFKGARDKIDNINYAQRARALGETKRTDKELYADAALARKHAADALNAQNAMDKLKRQGASDDQIANSPAAQKRSDALAAHAQLQQINGGKSARDSNNPMGGNTQGTTAPAPLTDLQNKMGGNTEINNPSKDAQAVHENQVEMLRLTNLQTDLLQQIATNTAGLKGGNHSSAGGAEDSGGGGGGLLGGLGMGLGALGKGIGRGLQGILTGLGQGFAALAGGLVALTPAIPVIGVLTLAAMGLGKALGYAAPAIEAFAPVLMKVADVIGNVFIKGLEMIPDIIGGIGDVIMGVVGAITDSVLAVIDGVTTAVERLANVNGANLLDVAGGLIAVSGALAAFGAGQAVAGIGTLIGTLLTPGKGSPIDQLMNLANMSQQLNDAANGISSIGQAMQSFGNIDKKQMDAINEFPWVKATAFVAAGGAMSANGAKVYNASKGNADEQAKVDAKAGAAKPSVNTANVQQNSNTTTINKPPVRNQESSYSRYLSARY